MKSVHVAVIRRVKPGCEAAFEEALNQFARDSLQIPGMTGIHLIEPVPGANGSEYGILRSFENEEASQRFYESELLQEWQKQVAHLIIGEPVRRRLHRLFQSPEKLLSRWRGEQKPYWRKRRKWIRLLDACPFRR